MIFSLACSISSTEHNTKCCAYDGKYLDAHAETTGNRKSMREVVDHVSQQIQPATSLQTLHHVLYTYSFKYSTTASLQLIPLFFSQMGRSFPTKPVSSVSQICLVVNFVFILKPVY